MTAKSYKQTIRLPGSGFSMKANLPTREPNLVEWWQSQNLWGKLREESKDRPKYILHDGPPYANGNIHIGTALNKILKDIINRSRQMTGYNANYVPGWDCHGLPIEWKIEEEYRAKGKNKDEVPILEFRQQCREFATHWLNVQREEFKRLGVFGDWEHPYSTMRFESEAIIAAEIHKFLMSGALYRGSRPIMWSVVEQTALAEAEQEYYDHKSSTITVAFKIVEGAERLKDANILIWTTTPWTIPANRAIAYHKAFRYVLIKVEGVEEDALVQTGGRYVLAASRLKAVLNEAKITNYRVIDQFDGAQLAGTIAAHPWRGQGYDQDTPLLEAEFVTDDQGTGFVHIAPSHGSDDWHLGMANGLEIPTTVLKNGRYRDDLPLLGGCVVLDENGKEGNANGSVIKALIAANSLFSKSSLRHQYPHSWRSKAPLIFLNTPQWFISLSHDQLREKALSGIDETKFYPEQGRTRLYGMIEHRPDWCISRQRAWGVPIAIFVNQKTGEPLRDPQVNQRIIDAFKEQGGDAWFALPPEHFLGSEYDPAEYEQVTDVVDVWFDSGSTHAFCLEPRSDDQGDLAWPADLYLEGSDQHRGWFHSSLLEACGTRGTPPYKAILTHGFVLAQDGRKMSKSLKNQVFPQEVNEKMGADILRLWVVCENYFGDVRIGQDTLKQISDYYRRFRNTLRWLLGNLANRPQAKPMTIDEMPLLEQWIAWRLKQIDTNIHASMEHYDFGAVFRQLLQFCTVDLSAIYFDVRKDSLYCDGTDAKRLQACYQMLDLIFSCLTKWLAPILVFTAEEAYQERLSQLEADGVMYPASVHLTQFPDLSHLPTEFKGQSLMEAALEARRAINGLLEQKRTDKIIGSSLEASIQLVIDSKTQKFDCLLDQAELMKELAILSEVSIEKGHAEKGNWQHEEITGLAVRFKPAKGHKCPRCWTIHQDRDEGEPDFDVQTPVCARCHTVLKKAA